MENFSTEEKNWVPANCQGGLMKCWGGGGGGGVRRRGNLVMEWHPFQGRVVILLVMSCYKETGMSSGRMGHVARMQTLPFH